MNHMLLIIQTILFVVMSLDQEKSLLHPLRSQNSCDYVFELQSNISLNQLFHLKIPHIEPYLQRRKLCFVLTITKDFTLNQNTTESIQLDDKLYFLRIDSMPNECISVKNDVRFCKANTSNHQEPLYLAEVTLSKQCAKITKKSTQTNLIQPIDLIIEVRTVIIDLFGFPLYEKPFKDLSFLVFVLIGILFLLKFINQNQQKQKSS